MLDVLTWGLLLLSGLIGLGLFVYMKKEKMKRNSNIPANGQKTEKKKKEDLKNMYCIKDIRKGVIQLTDNRYRMIMRLASADFFLLSSNEQTVVEDSLISTLMGLSFPIQILITSEAIDTRTIVQDTKKNIDNLNPKMRDYAIKFIQHMEALKTQKTAAMRSAYIVIPFETERGLDYAYTELIARAGSLYEGIKASKINGEILDTAAVVDLLHHLLNRGKLWRPSDADEEGVMEMIHVSQREVFNINVQTA